MRRGSFLAVVLLLSSTAAPAAGAGGALDVRLVRPDRQLERLLALFEGAPAAHPAAALAAWRRAARDPDVLSKAQQAALAALNPEMVGELRPLDGASLALDLDADGRPRWALVVPGDDGSFAALATALALTDGAAEPPLGGAAVDRLGRPGSWLMARLGRAVVVAPTRDDLAAGLDRLAAAPPPDRPSCESGWLVHLDPPALARSGAPAARRLGAGLGGLGVAAIDGVAGLDGEALGLVLTTRLEAPGAAASAALVDPSWLDAVPASGVSAAFALAIDPDPAARDRLFRAADLVEKADPARAGAAPFRSRLNLLANAAGVRPEVEIWPALRGLSGFATADDAGRTDGVVLGLHAVDEPAASRLAGRVAPRLARAFGLPAGGPAPDGWSPLGTLAGRPLALARRGATVLIGWGTAAPSRALAAMDDPGRSAGPALRASWTGRRVARFAAAWPGRAPLPSLRPPAGSALGAALADSPPILWWGEPVGEEGLARDEVRWDGLRATVRRLLDRLPLEPARP